MEQPLITNDAVVFGLLMSLLGFVFYTSSSESSFWKKFYAIVPTVLVCYFLPSIFNSTGIISGETSRLYFVASRYLLPAALVLLTVSVDLREVAKLGSKALAMFFAGTMGIVLGGPLALMILMVVAPSIVGGEPPNEVFQVNGELFSKMVTVDILIGNSWLAVLLIGVGRAAKIDRFLKADSSAIEELKNKVEAYQASITKIPSLADIVLILAVGFGVTGLSHLLADQIAPFLAENYPALEKYSLTSGFFWIVVIATTLGVILSFTKLRHLEGAGASKIGGLFIYVLVATIGMQMDLMAIFENPGLFLLGILWISLHVIFLFVVAKLIKAPYFFVAVGSQANVGGAASAPIVAAAFHPALAPVGVLLAVLGYAVGTYGAWLCGILMQAVASP
jgi:uncharacterized membrane protein